MISGKKGAWQRIVRVTEEKGMAAMRSGSKGKEELCCPGISQQRGEKSKESRVKSIGQITRPDSLCGVRKRSCYIVPSLHLISILAIILLPSGIFAASFDCIKARTEVEKMICANNKLSNLDEKMAAAYQVALQDGRRINHIQQVQKRWLKERNGCLDVDSLKRAYQSRLQELSGNGELQIKQEARSYPAEPLNKLEPRYRLALGKGTSVCEAYLKHLNAFPLEEPAMICERKLHPTFTNIKKPEWEEIDPWQHLDWLYEIDYYLHFPNHPNEDYYGYTFHDKKALTFEEWHKDYEARTTAKGIKPRLYRAMLTIEDWALPRPKISLPSTKNPLVRRQHVFLAYDTGDDRCIDFKDKNENIAINGGGLYHIFLLDETATRVDPMAFNSWPGSKHETDLLIYAGRTYFAYSGKKDMSGKHGTLFIAKPIPMTGDTERGYVFDDTCRIDFTYGNAGVRLDK